MIIVRLMKYYVNLCIFYFRVVCSLQWCICHFRVMIINICESLLFLALQPLTLGGCVSTEFHLSTLPPQQSPCPKHLSHCTHTALAMLRRVSSTSLAARLVAALTPTLLLMCPLSQLHLSLILGTTTTPPILLWISTASMMIIKTQMV